MSGSTDYVFGWWYHHLYAMKNRVTAAPMLARPRGEMIAARTASIFLVIPMAVATTILYGIDVTSDALAHARDNGNDNGK